MEQGKEMEESILTKRQSPTRLILFCARLWAKETTLVVITLNMGTAQSLETSPVFHAVTHYFRF